jgi:hypothetical protein
MEPPAFDLIDDDELMEEALAILDSVDIDHFGGASLSGQPAQDSPSDQAAADALLQTAVQAVQAVFPHDNKQPPASEGAALPKQKYDVHSAIQAKPAATSRNGPIIGTNRATPRSRGQGGGRTRMREQLIQLRAVVQKMLRSPRSSRFSGQTEDSDAVPGNENDSSLGNEAGGSTDEAAAWRKIAIQQFHARRHAEQQNAELRESLATQMQLSKQVENLLQGQQPHPVSADLSRCREQLGRTHLFRRSWADGVVVGRAAVDVEG